MNDDLNTWTPPYTVPSLRDLESGRIKPIMDIALPGLTPSSTSGSQAGVRTSRLEKMHERLQARTPDSPAREAEPRTWREYPVRSAMIANYKKNTDGACHRHNRDDWTSANARGGTPSMTRLGCNTHAAQNTRRHGPLDHWGQYCQVPDADSGALAGGYLLMPQLLASLQMLELGKVYTVTLIMGTNDGN